MLFEFEDSTLEPIYEKVSAGTRLSYEDGVTLWKTQDLLGVGYMANIVRERKWGQDLFHSQPAYKPDQHLCSELPVLCLWGQGRSPSSL